MIPEVDALFDGLTPAAYAVLQYCASCVAHRIIKVGWEPQVNYYDARRLILLGMYLPPHCRVRIVEEAYAKARATGDQKVLALIESMRVQPMKATA